VEEADVPRNGDALDAVICAELPHPEREPQLFAAVTEYHMHGPCGPLNPACPCMRNGRCSKHYRKAFCEETQLESNGYSVYRRRDNGRVFLKAMRGGRPDAVMDNRDVVPYNRALLLKYRCHINIEFCASVQTLKYLYKYILKGHDRAQVR
jgi:hypothetical protein